MAEISVSETIPAAADRVWTVIGGFGSLTDWLPAISACTVMGQGMGAIRTLGFVGSDVYAKERLDAHDDAGRTYSYSVAETDLPLASYRSTIRVEPVGDARCRLHWSAVFAASEGSEPDLAAMIEQTYRDGIARITELAGR